MENIIDPQFHQRLKTVMAGAIANDPNQKNNQRAKILVVGDVMLDSYIHGRVDRISQEAPIPVLLEDGATVYRAGGAANVASNIATLGLDVLLVGVVGNDTAGLRLQSHLEKKLAGHYQGYLIKDNNRMTTEKTRYIANQQQMLRFDREQTTPPDDIITEKIIKKIDELLPLAKAVVLSDYGKGMLSPKIIQHSIALAQRHNLPLVVDPKGRDFAKYRGATYITPNRQELHGATQLPIDSDDDITTASQTLIKQHGFYGVLATRSEKGLSLVEEKGRVVHYHTDAREVYDVAGAGDTVVAVFAGALAAGLPAVFASRLANAGGGVVVGKRGTADATIDEILSLLFSSIHHQKKYHDDTDDQQQQALNDIADWKKSKQKIVVANGCFDLLHDGHLLLLNEASAQGDRLVVLINSDPSVQKLKGTGRPFQPAMVRADALLGVPVVDMVLLFNDDTPEKIIAKIKPDVLVKGADYKGKDIVGSKDAKKIHLVNLADGHSTTAVLKKIQK